MKVTIEYQDLNGAPRTQSKACKDPEAKKKFIRSITSKGGVIKQVFG
jgi:hypothetical protein